MGYFATNVFKAIEEAGAYDISRLPANTHVCLDNEQHPTLESYLKAQPTTLQKVDLTVELTAGKRHSTRLIAIRCSEEVTNQRRAKAKAHRKKMGSQANQLSIEREGWSIYVTNLSKEHLEILLHAMMIYSQLTVKTFSVLKKAHVKWKTRLSIELVASWFGKEIERIDDL